MATLESSEWLEYLAGSMWNSLGRCLLCQDKDETVLEPLLTQSKLDLPAHTGRLHRRWRNEDDDRLSLIECPSKFGRNVCTRQGLHGWVPRFDAGSLKAQCKLPRQRRVARR